MTTTPPRDDTRAAPPANGARHASALLVEGTPGGRKRIQALLAEMGCRCDAPDPDTGDAVALDARYDFLFIDLALPWIDVVAATRAIRQRMGPHSPLVVGIGSPTEAWTGTAPDGLDYFLERPVQKRALQAILAD
jgi:CheY-like chemotaxis protein